MKKADILIANKDGVYNVKVDGRATYECTPPLRNLAKELEQTVFKKICVDLKTCTGMDSTFMGILTMLGLRAKKTGAEMVVYNASEYSVSLLHGLGIKKLFSYVTGDMDFSGGAVAPVADSQASPQEKRIENAEMVLDAHKTLMEADESNVKKFEKVVEFTQKDLDSIKNQPKKD
jgi:anti-anti-sigma regulatory factor